MKKFFQISNLRDQRGAVAIIVAATIFVLVGLAAFAIDISNIHVARAELQNAADAGALAGANTLYISGSQASINTGCNQVANNASTANSSQNTAVEVAAVERGHWCCATRTFFPNASTTQVSFLNRSAAALDADQGFINAVRVVTTRMATPVASFFARIFGRTGFTVSAQAVAYRGFVGTTFQFEVDQPIAICQQSILQDGAYSCNIGRMINSGQNVESHETAGWSTLSQPCEGAASASEVRPLVCADGNPDTLNFGEGMGTNGGEIQSAFTAFRDCWEAETGKTSPWNMTLPVIDCPGNNVGPCSELVGAVNVNVVWVTGPGEDPGYSEVPTHMDGVEDGPGDFDYDPNVDGETNWNRFAEHFGLRNVGEEGDDYAPYNKKSIYFLPSCEEQEPIGLPGGPNFGILSQIAVLVQ